MYGKIFASMYEGSMVGMGPTVFAIWGYCIAKADCEDHTVLLNPSLLAGIIGTTPEEVTSAITRLTSPDAQSKNKDHEGRRLLHQSGFCYLVVSHEHYRNMKNMSDVREYERLRKRAQRNVPNVRDIPGQSGTPASASVVVSGIPEGVQGEREPKLKFTIEDCLKASDGIGMTKEQVEVFFRHFAAVDFIDANGRKIVSLKHALAKWKARDEEIQEEKKEKYDPSKRHVVVAHRPEEY